MVCLTRKSMLLMPLLMKKSLHATCSVDANMAVMTGTARVRVLARGG